MDTATVQVIVLGSGTSHGVPIIGCQCPVCTSTDPRNRRFRTSAALRLGSKTLLVDTTPDLHLQAITAGLARVDAVFYTHSHADHIMGFDELRRFSELACQAMPVYASPATLSVLYRVFSYALTDDSYGFFGIPVVRWHALEGPVDIGGYRVSGVPVEHGEHLATAIRVDSPEGRSTAWCPDCSGMAASSRERLRGLDVMFLDGLRHRHHPTHFTVAEAVATLRDLAPQRAYLIHMTHDLDHAITEANLPPCPEVPGGVRLAYDGLVVDVA